MHNNRLYEQAQYYMQRTNLLENELSEEKEINQELIEIVEALCQELGFTFEELLEAKSGYEYSEEQREKSDDPTRTRAGREMNKKAWAERIKEKKEKKEKAKDK